MIIYQKRPKNLPYRWFAWYPVRIEHTKMWVWLEWVKRRDVDLACSDYKFSIFMRWHCSADAAWKRRAELFVWWTLAVAITCAFVWFTNPPNLC